MSTATRPLSPLAAAKLEEAQMDERVAAIAARTGSELDRSIRVSTLDGRHLRTIIPGELPAATPQDLKELACSACGDAFTHPRCRGRYPQRCPRCRSSASASPAPRLARPPAARGPELGAAAQRVLATLANLGAGVTPEILGRLGRLTAEEVERALRELVDVGLARPHAFAPTDEGREIARSRPAASTREET